MPVRNKTYSLAVVAGVPRLGVVPGNPGRRSLFIQNTSAANPGQLRLGEPNQGVTADITIAAGAFILWDQADTCPQESVNLSSAAATTWCVMEGSISG